jgi:thiol-disulfide isomerase/thioredoxin
MPSDTLAIHMPRSKLPWWVVTATVVFSASLAIVLAVWIVQPAPDEPVTLDEFLGGQPTDGSGADGEAEVGQPAPATTFELLDGGSTTLDEYAGQPVLINFWASTCAPCIEEMPALEDAHQLHGVTIQFLGVDVSESVDNGRKMVERTGVTYLQARDPRGELTRAYGGLGLPLTVVVDSDGIVMAQSNRALSPDDIEELLASVT